MALFIQDYFHLLSAIIGALCVYESHILLKAKDFWMLDRRLLWTTSIELIWVIVCCFGLFSWTLTGWKTMSCLIFLVNYIFACVYTWLLFRKINIGDPEFAKSFRIPRWYLEYYFSFGAIYCLTNAALFLVK